MLSDEMTEAEKSKARREVLTPDVLVMLSNGGDPVNGLLTIHIEYMARELQYVDSVLLAIRERAKMDLILEIEARKGGHNAVARFVVYDETHTGDGAQAPKPDRSVPVLPVDAAADKAVAEWIAEQPQPKRQRLYSEAEVEKSVRAHLSESSLCPNYDTREIMRRLRGEGEAK